MCTSEFQTSWVFRQLYTGFKVPPPSHQLAIFMWRWICTNKKDAGDASGRIWQPMPRQGLWNRDIYWLSFGGKYFISFCDFTEQCSTHFLWSESLICYDRPVTNPWPQKICTRVKMSFAINYLMIYKATLNMCHQVILNFCMLTVFFKILSEN